MLEGIIGAIVLVCVFCFGWVHAHNSIAKECEKLGGFYIGNTVYECKAVSKKEAGS